jgi:hypothetical protein
VCERDKAGPGLAHVGGAEYIFCASALEEGKNSAKSAVLKLSASSRSVLRVLREAVRQRAYGCCYICATDAATYALRMRSVLRVLREAVRQRAYGCCYICATDALCIASIARGCAAESLQTGKHSRMCPRGFKILVYEALSTGV